MMNIKNSNNNNNNMENKEEHHCLTAVRQIMVPAMTISSILFGIWMRYSLKHSADLLL